MTSTVPLRRTGRLRRRARVEPGLERAATGAAIGALKLAHVVALVIDASLGVHDQDLAIGRLVAQEGRACVAVLNKWDAVSDRHLRQRAIAERLETRRRCRRWPELRWVPLSALTGAGLERLLPAVRAAFDLPGTPIRLQVRGTVNPFAPD